MKRRTLLRTAGGLLPVLALSGCASYYYGDKAGGSGGGLMDLITPSTIERNHRAADALLLQAPLDPQHAVLVATLVNVDRLNESSRLGRIFSEQIGSRLVRRGLRVTELKLREDVAMQRTGELLLSREVREVSRAHDAQAVVVGTYAVSTTTLFISLKIVNPVGNTVVAAHDYAMPVDENVRSLLAAR
ncbi:FlgO family outer membrane protein [Acidovorax sp. LjRoot66]|uniref:FlgO family outer membrane protein n=1 Tax=Acidovorax sp. LjRoot66 TaxID=3342334 RepID=UPI003ECF8B0E